MTTEQRTALIAEIRTDYQVPPYITDEVIGRAVDKCFSRLSFIQGVEFDVESDLLGRELLQNAAYYEIYHRYEEFEPAWKPMILSWQLGAVSSGDSTPTSDGTYRVTGRSTE